MYRIKISSIFFVLFLITFASSLDYETPPKVTIKNGVLTETIYKTILGQKVYGFFGIPYAAPPTGVHRFKPPQPVTPWKGEWNATTQSSVCFQYVHSPETPSTIGEEDCLYLDIYTPKLPSGNESLLDVIVFIHGGCFMFGSGTQEKGDYLMENRNLVYVAINYRLGALGFLSTGDDVVPGNNGLKDQVQALKWVKENIARFGGDPNKVTIAGLSAGATSVHYHLLSPMSEGLFKQAISQSGTALSPRVEIEAVITRTKQLAGFLGCPNSSNNEMITCMQTRPAKQIVSNMKHFLLWRYNPFSPFGPIIERQGKNRFLTQRPIDIIRNGQVKNIPWMISLTKNEGLYPAVEFISNPSLMKEINDNWTNIAPLILNYHYIANTSIEDKISQEIRQFYFGDGIINSTLEKTIGDKLFVQYAIFAIQEQVKANPGPIYFSNFFYRGKYSLTNLFTQDNKDYGISHADDNQYVLKVMYGHPYDNPRDTEMISFMTSLWTSFAQNGKPIIKDVEWPAVSKSTDKNIDGLVMYSPFEFALHQNNTNGAFDIYNKYTTKY